MVRLQILSGKMAGTEMVARHFPFNVGRASSQDFPIDEPGIFDQHFHIELNSTDGFFLITRKNTFITINGNKVENAPLHNGDLIELGSVKIRFSLSDVRQHGLKPREWVTWIALGLFSLAQIALIYWLIRI